MSDTEIWLEDATLDDLRPLARAWILEQRKAELVKYEPPGQQVRIEALRAAATVAGPIWAEVARAHWETIKVGGKPPDDIDDRVALSVKRLAKSWSAWLETGE